MDRHDFPRPFRVKSARVLRVLNSPERMAVVEALQESSPRSASELAERLECGVPAAHYHLKRLIEIGLVEEAGQRETGARPERLFQLTAPDIVLEPERLTPSFRREMVRGVRSFLRTSERDFGVALEDDGAAHRAAGRLRITRDVVRLSDEDLAELSEKLLAIDDFLRERNDAAKEHRVGLTILLAPATPPGRSSARGSSG